MTVAQYTRDTKPAETTQDFLAFLAAMAKGRTVAECGEKLQELVAAIENTGKGGSLTLRLTIKPVSKNGQEGAVTVTDEVILKAPKLTRPESIFFADGDHNLVRSNPNQSELF